MDFGFLHLFTAIKPFKIFLRLEWRTVYVYVVRSVAESIGTRL